MFKEIRIFKKTSRNVGYKQKLRSETEKILILIVG